MMGLIDEAQDGQRRFGVGHFDLVIIDEAHRSVYQKYRAIFEYFDSLLVGLTATPKDEIDRNTYGLFDLESGVPTDAYPLEDAVMDGFLVPPKAVSVPLRFPREGIRYDELSDEEKEQWDATDWGDESDVRDRVEAEAVNRWLFNQDTVDKVLAHLMERGIKVAGGDRLGKTIIFAKSHAHAEFIAERFNVHYPKLRGEFARVIDFKVEYAQSLIDAFANPARSPHIAISVDMLDTGIDIPQVVNLVFFKLVRSKTKFWQMLGRGTRLSLDLFGPGRHKEFFYVFDYCENLEFFATNPETTDGASGDSLGKRVFEARLELISELDGQHAEPDLRQATAETLRAEVLAMNVDNFVVRARRRQVEKYRDANAWTALSPEAIAELSGDVAGLPSELEPEDEEPKRFDLLLLNLQLAVLRTEPVFERLRQQLEDIAGLLAEKSSIPMIQRELALIHDLLSDVWWKDVTPAMLETVRRRLRSLVKLIEKGRRKPVYTDLEDVMGEERAVELLGFASPQDFERFRAKARQFLREHQSHPAVGKIRGNQPLDESDIAALERLLVEGGIGTAEDVRRARNECDGRFGLFVRSLVGLEREAAKEALAGFVAGKTLSADQIEFVGLIVDHLSEHGFVEVHRLYESPYTDLSPRGVDGLFGSAQVDELVRALAVVRERAAA